MLNETGKFYVTFDPIDGSTVIDCNFSIGSIFGIWMTKDLEGKTGRQLKKLKEKGQCETSVLDLLQRLS